jgi:hypothetical protein
MINPAELVEALVAKLRAIPELVAEMDGDAGRIYAYHDSYPKRVSLPAAIYEMPVPAIMVAWQGTVPGTFGANEAWKHNLSLYLRAREVFEGDPPSAYYRLFSLIVNGVPASSALKLLYTTVHDRCHPMDTPSIQRTTDEQGTDYFEVNISFTEIGDA